MFGLRTENHRLIAETPLSLLALTRHPVESEEEEWFARCRADFMRSFPILLQEAVRIAIVMLVLAPVHAPGFRQFAIAGWCAVSFAQISVRILEREHNIDDKTALRLRAAIILMRALWWSITLFWALIIAQAGSREILIALTVAIMTIDTVSTVTLPFHALFASLSACAAMSAALLHIEGWAAAPVVALALFMGTSLHWITFNLYYLFATRRIRTRRLSQSNDTIRLLLNQYDDEGSDWLYETDTMGQIVRPSSRFGAATGLAPDTLEGLQLIGLLRDDGARRSLAERLNRHEAFRGHIVSLMVHDEERWWSISGRPMLGDNKALLGWRGLIADITETRRAEARIDWLAHYDALTGLANRTLFEANLEFRLEALLDHHPSQSLESDKSKPTDNSVGLMFVDLDEFKDINDTYGHAGGDRVLIEIARRLEQTVRPRDMVARLGGDEFVVLVLGAGTRTTESIAARILAAITEPIDLNGKSVIIGASIGYALAPRDASTPDELLRAADLALYHAKSLGRRCVAAFDPAMHHAMRERHQLELDLAFAIRHGQLELRYQALVDISSGLAIGYEALLRWHHPVRGMVPPTFFIPIAEETGLISEIGEWVLRKALDDAAQWPSNLCVAVNLSPIQIRDASLVGVIINALASSGVDPHRLELEITESVLLQESEEILEALHRLRAIGVRIALDDFGTGYSSLNYLRTFPFDKIKIDRCFVSELTNREDCKAIVRSVLNLANELHMTTIAEGVEFPEQLEALRASGCDQAQGYLFSQALPVHELGYGASHPDTKSGLAASNITPIANSKTPDQHIMETLRARG